MWLFGNNHSCFGYIQITTLIDKNTFGAPYFSSFVNRMAISSLIFRWTVSTIANKD